MLDSRAIALEGVGYGSRVLALFGFYPPYPAELERAWRIWRENRRLAIEAENRLMQIMAESRGVAPAAEGRAYKPGAENRTLILD